MKMIFKYVLMGLVCLGLNIQQVEAEDTMKQQENVHSFVLNDIDGKPVNLSEYKGKTLLIVNTASRCGYTKQYKSLQELYLKYKDQGLVVLGFPANNFMGQEPGSNEEIKSFCSLKFNVSFPMFAKVSVKGGDIHPLFRYLTGRPGMEGDVSWNFNKFLVSADGNLVARYGSGTDPLSEEMLSAIDGLIGK